MDFPVEIDIPGKFSIYNSLTAIAICRHFKVSEENIIKALKVARVKGRIEMIKVSDEFTLMIDYAHNAMALESLLGTLKEYDPHRLVCLFGCGGNRSKLRRYEMGEVSGKMADLTSSLRIIREMRIHRLSSMISRSEWQKQTENM